MPNRSLDSQTAFATTAKRSTTFLRSMQKATRSRESNSSMAMGNHSTSSDRPSISSGTAFQRANMAGRPIRHRLMSSHSGMYFRYAAAIPHAVSTVRAFPWRPSIGYRRSATILNRTRRLIAQHRTEVRNQPQARHLRPTRHLYLKAPKCQPPRKVPTEPPPRPVANFCLLPLDYSGLERDEGKSWPPVFCDPEPPAVAVTAPQHL